MTNGVTTKEKKRKKIAVEVLQLLQRWMYIAKNVAQLCENMRYGHSIYNKIHVETCTQNILK